MALLFFLPFVSFFLPLMFPYPTALFLFVLLVLSWLISSRSFWFFLGVCSHAHRHTDASPHLRRCCCVLAFLAVGLPFSSSFPLFFGGFLISVASCWSFCGLLSACHTLTIHATDCHRRFFSQANDGVQLFQPLVVVNLSRFFFARFCGCRFFFFWEREIIERGDHWGSRALLEQLVTLLTGFDGGVVCKGAQAVLC